MKQVRFESITKNIIAAIAVVGMVASSPLGGVRSAEASSPEPLSTQTAEIHVLLTAVHGLTSYNGDPAVSAHHLAEWSQLWAEDATILVNGTALYEGKNAIFTGFFANAPFFHNNWIGLTPSFRKQIDIHGNTAEVYLECIFLDESETVVAKSSLSGTIKKVNGQWMFWHMNANPAAPLF